MKHIVDRALAEVEFNNFKKHQLSDDEIRFCLVHPEAAIFIFNVEMKIFWILFYINRCFL